MGTTGLTDIVSIVRSAKSGDKEAMSNLINATKDRFYKFVYCMTGDKSLADDVCQESYVRVLDKINKLKDEDKFIGWLYRIGRNVYLDHIKNKNNRYEPLEDMGHTHVDNIEDAIYINEVLKRLDIDERIVLLAVDMEGRSYSETAELLDISEDTVRMRLFRARQKFLSFFETLGQSGSSNKQEKQDEIKERI